MCRNEVVKLSVHLRHLLFWLYEVTPHARFFFFAQSAPQKKGGWCSTEKEIMSVRCSPAFCRTCTWVQRQMLRR